MKSGVVLDVKIVTYLCSSQADRIIAPDTIKYFPEQSSSVIPVSTVTGWLFRSLYSSPLSPLNVSLDNAPLSKWMSKFMDVQEVPAKT